MTETKKLSPHITINKLSEKNKKTLNTRTIFAVVFCVFYLFTVVNSILCDTQFGWFPQDNQAALVAKQFFAYMQIVWMSIISVFAAKEILNLHFYKNISMFIVVMFSILVCTIAPSIIFVSEKFNYFNHDKKWYFISFMITMVVVYLLTYLVNFIGFWVHGLLDAKKMFVHFVLLTLVSLYITSWIYFSFFKGWVTMVILFLIVTLTDSMAYICGMFFGKKKFSAYISPNKTVGGVAGGIFFTTLIVMLIFFGLSYTPDKFNILGNFFGIKYDLKLDNLIQTNNTSFSNAPWWWVSVFFIIVVLTIVAITGDLAYSYIKRMYKIKDFSHLLPGHGGVLDRIDSHSFVVPVFFIFTILISYFSSTAGLF